MPYTRLCSAGLGSSNAFGGLEGSGLPGRPGAIGIRNGSIGYELDFTNWDANSTPGVGAFTVGQYVHAQGSYTSLSALYFDANMDVGNNNSGWTDGILLNGERVISDNTFVDATHSKNSLTIAGKHKVGLNTTDANEDLHAVAIKAGQTVCLNELADCVTWKNGRLTYVNQRGEQIVTIDENGNAFFRGHVFSR